MATAQNIINTALQTAGIVGNGQVSQSGDVALGLNLLNEMIVLWGQERAVLAIPGTLPTFPGTATDVPFWDGYLAVLNWNLVVRIKTAYGLPVDETQASLAQAASAVLQANNKQVQPAIHAGPPTTPMQVIFLALRMAGRITDKQGVSDQSQDVADAFSLLVSMLGQWQKERWLVWGLTNYAIPSTGSPSYTIGPGGDLNIGRPTKIESAFARLNPNADQPIDYPLTVIGSREDFDQIWMKKLGTIPATVFYDAGYPLGTLRVWPVAPVGYEIHVSIIASLPVYASVNDPLGLPAEYMEAIISNLACRILLLSGGSPGAELSRLATKTRQTLRQANTQIGRLQMPGAVLSRAGNGSSWGWGVGNSPGNPTTYPIFDSNGNLILDGSGQQNFANSPGAN